MSALKGGDKLRDYLAKAAGAMGDAATLDVGFFDDSVYPDGTPMATVAAVREYGAPARNIPPRPFFRKLIAQKSGEWGDDLAALLKDSSDAQAALTQLGQTIAAQLRASLIATNDPPSAAAQPLSDTGPLAEAVKARVSSS